MTNAAIATNAPSSLALVEHRNLRMATLFLLYVAQGLPFGLVDFALLAWLAQNGAPAAAIGSILAMMTLPWTFKLAYGFVMDRYAFLAMGRRRPWIIVAQFGLVATLPVCSPDQMRILLDGTVAYWGTYSVDAAAGEVIHHVTADLSNGYIATDQRRPFRLSGDRLEIGDGKTWTRVLQRAVR